MPQSFFYPDRLTQLWTPLAFTDKQAQRRGTRPRGLRHGSAGSRPARTIAQLDAQMDAIVKRNIERVGGTPRGAGWKHFIETSGFTGRARSLRDAWVGDLRPTLWLLQALVCIACC